MSPLISVLLPVFNAKNTLNECLQSIFRQTYFHYEIVAVDDGSQDDTLLLLDHFGQREPRLKIQRFSRHRGIVAALNEGLNHCRGDYIARMDADDRMLPERLALQLRFAQTHSRIDLLGCQFRLFREDAPLSPAQLRYEEWSNHLLDDDGIKKALFLESPIAHPSFFARRAFFETMKGYREMPWAEDYDFLLRAWQRGATLGKVPAVLMEKRDSPTRLYRTDPRCKRPALLRAKAHFFTRGAWLQKDQRLFLAGTGSSGRTVAAALQREGVTISGFIDHREGLPQRTVMGIPVYFREGPMMQSLLQQMGQNFFILCIGDLHGRLLQETQLKTAGLQPGKHYLRFL